jgi:hypothetical protein
VEHLAQVVAPVVLLIDIRHYYLHRKRSEQFDNPALVSSIQLGR